MSVQIVSRLFDTQDQAMQAVEALDAAGIAQDDISIIGPGRRETGNAAAAAGAGAAVGAGAALLAGLGTMALPGIGPVVGAGWMASAALGAAAGGLIGALTDAVVGRRYAEADAHGIILVSVRVAETQANHVRAILAGRVAVAMAEAA
jgi:heat induced stress protein YflT